MSSYMRLETALFFKSVEIGVLLLLSYRLVIFVMMRLPGKAIRKRAVADLLFWSAAGLCLFSTAYKYNSGELRLFMLAGVAIGSFFVNSLFKRLLFGAKRCKILSNAYVNKYFHGFRRGRRFEKVKKKKKSKKSHK